MKQDKMEMDRDGRAAELLLKVAKCLEGKGIIEVDEKAMEHVRHGALARAELALKFKRKPLSFQLRALIEDWSPQRLIREMY